MDWEGVKTFLGIVGLLFMYSIPVIVVCVVAAKIVRMVKRRNDRKFIACLPKGFVQIRRNSIAVHPEKGEILFYPGNRVYRADQIDGAPALDVALEEIVSDRSGKIRLPGDQDRILVTKKDVLCIRTADGKEWRFDVKEDYEKSFAALRKFYHGRLTRPELEDAGFEA